MCEIKKMIFSVSEKLNPLAQIWVDDADTTKNSESIYIALKNQVAYLFFSEVGTKITLKKSKQYYNVEVPDSFTDIFEGYKTSPNNAIKVFGAWMNNAFNNAFKSLEFIKNGEVVKISQDEANAKCKEYMAGYTSLYGTVIESLKESNVKALKTVGKILEKEDSKAGDIKEANSIVSQFTTMLSREVIAKNNFIVEVSDENTTFDDEKDEAKKPTKSKAKTKKPKADDIEEEIPF